MSLGTAEYIAEWAPPLAAVRSEEDTLGVWMLLSLLEPTEFRKDPGVGVEVFCALLVLLADSFVSV